MDIISRSGANLPPLPASIGSRTLDSWTGIKIHHTGGRFTNWRGVHDWQTVGRAPGDRLAYIGYSFGVAFGRVTELRGWHHHPAHDHENSTLGVVVGGSYGHVLPDQADLDALVAFIGHARAYTGRDLPVDAHRDTWPAGHRYFSSCPGDRLYRWVREDLPALLEGSAGGGGSVGRPPPGPPVPFPLPAGHFFGPAEWGDQSVSGRYQRYFGGRTDRSWLQEWTRQLRRRGWPAGKGQRYLTDWGNDGIYGPEYRQLITAFQADQGLSEDGLLGIVTWTAAYHNPVT